MLAGTLRIAVTAEIQVNWKLTFFFFFIVWLTQIKKKKTFKKATFFYAFCATNHVFSDVVVCGEKWKYIVDCTPAGWRICVQHFAVYITS